MRTVCLILLTFVLSQSAILHANSKAKWVTATGQAGIVKDGNYSNVMKQKFIKVDVYL